MCDPALAMFALSTASAAASHKQASGMAKVQTAMHEINQENSIRAMGNEQYDIGARESQEREAAAMQVNERNIAALTQSAALTARMADTGVSGHTMSNLMRDVFVQEGRATSTIKTNMQWASDNAATQRLGTRNTAIQRMGQTSKGVGPSALATGLKIGAAGVTLWDAKTS